jgi:hypothetical protein
MSRPGLPLVTALTPGASGDGQVTLGLAALLLAGRDREPSGYASPATVTVPF